MPPARDLSRLLPGLFVWQEYDSAVKAELFSDANRDFGWSLH